MTFTPPLAGPLAALAHRGIAVRRSPTAVEMLTVYVLLLYVVPSNLTLGSLGSLGRPSMLWGLALLLWWVLSRLQVRAQDVPAPRQPVRWALGALVVLALVSFAAAMLRGQPADQVSPAVTALVRLASWSGVVLVAMDGIRTRNDAARLVRVLVLAAGGVALLGIAQFITGSSLLTWLASVPGITLDDGGVNNRGMFVRASGTATHPLEFVTAIIAVLPLAATTAISRGFTASRRRGLWWAVTAAILVVCLVAVSRAAIIGLLVALVLLLPWLPRAYRWAVGVGGLSAGAVVVVAVPGIWTTTFTLFAGASDDSSTQSRTDALARVPDFLATSPLIGQAWGTFLSRYYIFDNQWVGILLELGILGTLCVLLLVGCAVGSAVDAAQASLFADTRMLAGAVAAGIGVSAVSFLFFDALAFPISAGTFWLLIGLAAALRTTAEADRSFAGARARARVRASAVAPPRTGERR